MLRIFLSAFLVLFALAEASAADPKYIYRSKPTVHLTLPVSDPGTDPGDPGAADPGEEEDPGEGPGEDPGDVEKDAPSFAEIVPNMEAVVGTPMVSYTPSVANAHEEDVFELIGDLPEGLQFDAATGTISGTATQQGTFSLAIAVVDYLGNRAQSNGFTIAIGNWPAPAIGAVSDRWASLGGEFSLVPTVSNGSDSDVFEVSGDGLPDGLSIDASTGKISGVVDPNAQLGEYRNVIKLSNARGQSAQSNEFKITVAQFGAFFLDVSGAEPGERVYSLMHFPEGGEVSYDWVVQGSYGEVGDCSTPEIRSDGRCTYYLAGNSTANAVLEVGAGHFVQAGANASEEWGKTITMSVTFGGNSHLWHVTTREATEADVDAPEVAYSVTKYQVGEAIQIDPSTKKGYKVAFSASGLPSGLSIDADTGRISGSVDEAGTFPVSVTVTDYFDRTGFTSFEIEIEEKQGVVFPDAVWEQGKGFMITHEPWNSAKGYAYQGVLVYTEDIFPDVAGAVELKLHGGGSSDYLYVCKDAVIPTGGTVCSHASQNNNRTDNGTTTAKMWVRGDNSGQYGGPTINAYRGTPIALRTTLGAGENSRTLTMTATYGGVTETFTWTVSRP